MSFGLEFDDVINYSSGMIMMKFADNIIKNGSTLFKSPDLASIIQKKEKLATILEARKKEIEFKMNRVPMLKLIDKIYFVCGVTMCWVFAYLLGRYPRTYFIQFFTMLIIPLTAWRWVRYYKIGMHYYLIDLCYFSTALILYNIWFDPYNEEFMRIGYLLSHGSLAVSILAFRNSLVFHDMDCMTSMGIHTAPMLIMHHIRWSLIPEEQDWPPEQRQFPSVTMDLTTSEYLRLNLWNPTIFYGIWLFFYFIVNFVIAWSVIEKEKYNTLYLWFRD